MYTCRRSFSCAVREGALARIEKILFRKNPCIYNKTFLQILNETGLPYDTFDILSDEEVRQGLKTFSNWPTYPQVR